VGQLRSWGQFQLVSGGASKKMIIDLDTNMHIILSRWAITSRRQKHVSTLSTRASIYRIASLWALLSFGFQYLAAAMAVARTSRTWAVETLRGAIHRRWSLQTALSLHMDNIIQQLHATLGYEGDNFWVSLHTPSSRARALMSDGWTPDLVWQHLRLHNRRIDSVRVGMVLKVLDSTSWRMRTRNGNYSASSSDQVRVTRIKRQCLGFVEDTQNGYYGEVDLMNYMFDIA